MTRWLRRQFVENRPYDVLVRELITARGSTTAEGPAGFFKAVEGPEPLARSISQLFLGVRIECGPVSPSSFRSLGPRGLFRVGRILHRRSC